MASFPSPDSEEICLRRDICITAANQVENYTVYSIKVTVNDCSWSVQHRYSEFVELHEALLGIDKENKSLKLPPKKVFGNSSKSFIQKRQKELEVYLQATLEKNPTLPRPLLHFLEFDIYDINGVSQALAAELYEKGDEILASEDVCEMTPMQLYAITERLKLPLPTCETGDARSDIGHVMDFVAQLKYLRIVGSHNKLGNSSRKVDQLPFDVAHFKLLKHIQIDVCDVNLIGGLEELKPCLEFLAVHHSAANITEIVLPSASQWAQSGELKEDDKFTTLIPTWKKLRTVDFRYNRFKRIDETMNLLPVLERLDLSYNEISQIEHLDHLSNLTHLDLSHNAISHVEALHSKLGNVRTLNLCSNKLKSLKGLSRLYSVVNLDVGNNNIEEVVEIEHISNLPCIEVLVLEDNAVTSVVDYRTKVFELFQERYAEMKLDGQPASQKERDTVAVLKAIQKSKDNEQRMRQRSQSPHKKKTVQQAAIADPDTNELEESTTSINTTNSTPTSLSKTTPQGIDRSNIITPTKIRKPTLLELSKTVQKPLSPQDLEFRSRVEALQKEGGQSWLSMFNELQESSPTPSPSGTPKAGRSPVMSRRNKSKSPSKTPNRTPNRTPSRSPNRSPVTNRKVRSQEVEVGRSPVASERHLSPATAESPRFTSTTPGKNVLAPVTPESPQRSSNTTQSMEVMSPKTLASQICKELERHRAQGITSIQDILSTIFYYEGPHLRTFGPRHRKAGEDVPSEAGISALAVAVSMPSEKQREFLDILQGMSDSSTKEIQSSHVPTGGMTTCPTDIQDLLRFLKSMLQKSDSILKAPLSDEVVDVDPLVRGEFDRGVAKSEGHQHLVDGMTKSTDRLTVDACKAKVRPSSPKTIIPEYDQSVLDHLTLCCQNIKIPLSKSLQNLAAMEGAELVKFFHEKVAQISPDVEMLDHIVWTGVIPFLVPCKELMACVMLSSKAVYVMSDEAIPVTRSPSPSFIGHRRMKSDSAIGQIVKGADQSGIVGFNADRADKSQGNAGGVLHCTRDSSPKKRVKCQVMIRLTDLEEVIMGLFDQKLRLTGVSPEHTIVLLLRNLRLTHSFQDHLMSVLPVPESTTPHIKSKSSGIDFYKSQRSRTESCEYVHPSKVKFCYPNDETIGDLTYLIVVNAKGKKPSVDETNIMLYMLVYRVMGTSDMAAGKVIIQEPIERNTNKSPRTLVITNRHLTLCKEDHVSYPLPAFSKMLPDNPQYDIQEIQPIENLRRLVVSDFSSHDVSLVFEVIEVEVDVSSDYYSANTEGQRKSPVSPEVAWSLVLPSFEDRERLIKLLRVQWMEMSGGDELSIQVST